MTFSKHMLQKNTLRRPYRMMDEKFFQNPKVNKYNSIQIVLRAEII